MMSTEWNPWKMTAIGLGLVVSAALITRVVVANWSGHERVAPMAAGRLTRGVAAAASTR